MDSKGNIVDYKLYKTAGSFDPEKFSDAKKELMGNDVMISKNQMSGLKSELIKRGLYDNMRAVAGEALPNSSGLAGDLGL